MAELLATFVQISDLHVGDIDPVYGNAKLDRKYIRVASSFRRLDGLLGHHGRGLDELATFVRGIRPEEGAFRVIVTGDLTRSGSISEQAMAKDYLLSTIDLNPPARNMVGLNLAPDELICIPGNHDQWGGSWHPLGSAPKGYQPPVAGQVAPFVIKVTLGNKREVSFVCFDSDDEVKVRSWKRFWAMGAFSGQLMNGAVQLPPNITAEVRIALIHHSWDVATRELKIEKNTKAALGRYMQANGIAAMLSGHTHLFRLPPGAAGVPFHEIRCGSTTQHDVVPYNWVTITGKQPTRNWQRNTLLVHQLHGTPGQTTWTVQAYGRFTNAGFMPLGHQHSFTMVV